tara:strand:+ start:35 stop:550 length:516 start_codon:yes stop_codon:yes gene_type:complete
MKVEQLIKNTVQRECFFVTGKINIAVDYFIKEIEKGIKADNAENYSTNLISEMTSYEYFNKDKEFFKTLLPVFDLIDEHNILPNNYFIHSSWGFKQGFSHYSRKHNHSPASLSGAIALTEHDQTLYFPEIGKELKSKPGNFALFSSFIKHYNKRNASDDVRYGLSFNLMIN